MCVCVCVCVMGANVRTRADGLSQTSPFDGRHKYMDDSATEMRRLGCPLCTLYFIHLHFDGPYCLGIARLDRSLHLYIIIG